MDKFIYKKKFGQNFLQDQGILQEIASCLPITKEDLVIEIGAGHGALTQYLKKTKAYVLCYEIDRTTKSQLDKLIDSRCQVKYQDFLATDLIKDIDGIKYNNIYVVANLPYNITTPIIKKLIDTKIDIGAMCLMVQKEVGTRFTANPGCKDYGSLTIYLNYYFNIRKLTDVNRKYFKPVPNVDSSILIFETKEKNTLVIDENHLFELIKKAFIHKRKTIRNNLLDYDLTKVEKVLKKYDLSLASRAEQIPIKVFIDLSNNLVS